MTREIVLVCLLAVGVVVSVTAIQSNDLKIAAFNIKVFGRTKIGKSEVVDILKQIIQRYDIVLVQEIRDITETTIPLFLDAINQGDGVKYDAVISERVGRSSSKEQYAFLYRTEVVEVVRTYLHDDQDDTFEREPFSVLFREKEGRGEFFLLGIHVKPSDVFDEVEALGPAFEMAAGYLGNNRGVILGDLNAGCSYLSRSKYEQLSLVLDPTYIWLLGYDVDTTVSFTPCSYDRFIVHQSLNSSVVPSSAGVFNFTKSYSLTHDQAMNVSDHYPIEFMLDYDYEAEINKAGDDTNSSAAISLYLHSSLLLLTVSMTTNPLYFL